MYLRYLEQFIYRANLILGDPFAALIADQNPKFHRGTQEEAVSVIEAAHKRGDVQCAYFKKDFVNRLMEICSCCACSMAVRVWNMFGGTVPILAPSGYVARVGDNCDGCGVSRPRASRWMTTS